MAGRILLAAALALLPAVAGAQDIGPEELVGPPKHPTRGTSVSLLGGVDGFTGALDDAGVEPGPGWGLLVNVQPISELALEVVYSGSHHALKGSGLSDASLLRNSASANLKFTLSPTTVEPYLFAGLGFGWARLNGVPAGSGWERDDFFGTVPLGGGIKAHLGSLVVGLRGGLELLLCEEFAPASAEGNLWTGRLELGAKF